ncbi:hypothetical protein [Nocardia nova]|uniref:hypothetical protein n=1 Tax=Nocardia nova TaxID=37330 RepID=UPI0018939031|nr:hypothetical protein [Nocardia nova]MBF6277005.1 hypothetical protein [Nocardia nova]
MTGHELAEVRHPRYGVHIAACTCGWESPVRSKGRDARAAVKRHIAQAPPPELPCPTPTKRRYRTEEIARRNLTLARTANTDPGPLPSRIYLCQCGYWHLTSKPHYTPKGN